MIRMENVLARRMFQETNATFVLLGMTMTDFQYVTSVHQTSLVKIVTNVLRDIMAILNVNLVSNLLKFFLIIESL